MNIQYVYLVFNWYFLSDSSSMLARAYFTPRQPNRLTCLKEVDYFGRIAPVMSQLGNSHSAGMAGEQMRLCIVLYLCVPGTLCRVCVRTDIFQTRYPKCRLIEIIVGYIIEEQNNQVCVVFITVTLEKVKRLMFHLVYILLQ